MSQESGPGGSPIATAGGRGSSAASVARFVVRHPVGLAQCALIVLVAIVVLQNLEPTSVDFLFWTVSSLPKLVLILIAMGVGAVSWEIVRRLLR